MRLLKVISRLEAEVNNKMHISLFSSSLSKVCLPKVVLLKRYGCDLAEERDDFKRNRSFTFFGSITN